MRAAHICGSTYAEEKRFSEHTVNWFVDIEFVRILVKENRSAFVGESVLDLLGETGSKVSKCNNLADEKRKKKELT